MMRMTCSNKQKYTLEYPLKFEEEKNCYNLIENSTTQESFSSRKKN